VQVLDERFGMELGEVDQLLFDQCEREWVDDPELAAQARAESGGLARVAGGTASV
jgi:hypothetical protein